MQNNNRTCQNIVFKMCGYKIAVFDEYCHWQTVSNNANGIKMFRLKAIKL